MVSWCCRRRGRRIYRKVLTLEGRKEQVEADMGAKGSKSRGHRHGRS